MKKNVIMTSLSKYCQNSTSRNIWETIRIYLEIILDDFKSYSTIHSLLYLEKNNIAQQLHNLNCVYLKMKDRYMYYLWIVQYNSILNCIDD